MATRREFVDAAIQCYENHDVYIGTGNGELLESLTIGKIHKMEQAYNGSGKTADRDTRRDLAFIGACYEKGLDMSAATAEDCSGLVVKIARLLGIIKPSSDYRARDLQKMATKISLSSLQPGDLIFDKLTDAAHVGIYADGYTIDSRGRDQGVIKGSVSDKKWVIGGRMDNWFTEEIPPLKRELYYNKSELMRGDDVRQAQERLKYHGCDPGALDGVFGLITEAAVIEFQTSSDLNIKRLGVIGAKTWKKLWEV